MTCFAYDDLEQWRSIYPVEIFEDQFTKLCAGWEEGLALLADEPETEPVIMAKAGYALFKSSLNQIRFIRARDAGNREAALAAAIGFEASNHYYFSKGQLAEKIVNCYDIIEKFQ